MKKSNESWILAPALLCQDDERRPYLPQQVAQVRYQCPIVSHGIRRLRGFFLLALVFLLMACSHPNSAPKNRIMVASLSSDGHYAITTNTNKQAILWNLHRHTYQIIFSNANIYSAYFIKNTYDFMYQNDATNQVVIENVEGSILKTFNPGFPTYGEVITPNLANYFAVDCKDQLFKMTFARKQQLLWHFCDERDPQIPRGVPYTCGSFPGDGKLLNLHISPDDKYLVTSGFGEFYVWSISSGDLRYHAYKNDAQTVAAISPDGQYVVTGDIMSRGIKYDFSTRRTSPLFIYSSPMNPQQQQLFGQGATEILAIKFISNNQLLVIYHGYPHFFNYATLYNTAHLDTFSPYEPGWISHQLVPITYLPLIPHPETNLQYQKTWPLTDDDFSRDQAIDTSPTAHILVMAMDHANGIIVYHYDPKTQTLSRVWAGIVKSPSLLHLGV